MEESSERYNNMKTIFFELNKEDLNTKIVTRKAIKSFLLYRKETFTEDLLILSGMLSQDNFKEAFQCCFLNDMKNKNNKENIEGYLPRLYITLFFLHSIIMKKTINNEEKKFLFVLEESLKEKQLRNCLFIKIVFYLTRIYTWPSLFKEKKKSLITLLTAATLSNNREVRGLLINGILRGSILSSSISFGKSFIENCDFPENSSFITQAKCFYYNGRIKAIVGEYKTSYSDLEHAVRLTPISKHTKGFRQHLLKLFILVTLLNNKIPKKNLFKENKKALSSYLKITKKVLFGNVFLFKECLQKEKETFIKDNNQQFAFQLEKQVVQSGLKKICFSYKTIQVEAITKLLGLQLEEDTIGILLKCIKDKIIRAELDEEKIWVTTQNDSYDQLEECFSILSDKTKQCHVLLKEIEKATFYPDETEKIVEQVIEDSDDDFEMIDAEF